MRMRKMIILAAVGSICLGSLAQTEPEQVPGVRSIPRRKGEALAPPAGETAQSDIYTRPIDINFPGGSAEDLLESMEKALQSKPNIIISPALAEQAEMPKFQLRHVTLSEIFTALNTIARSIDSKWIWQPAGNSGVGPIWTLVEVKQQQGQAPPVYFQQGRPMQPQRTAQIFNVSKYLERYTIEDITTAVETAWQMLKIPESAEMKFHGDTQLLIAVGDATQLAVINQVLLQLEQNVTGPTAKGEAKKPASVEKNVGGATESQPKEKPKASQPAK